MKWEQGRRIEELDPCALHTSLCYVSTNKYCYTLTPIKIKVMIFKEVKMHFRSQSVHSKHQSEDNYEHPINENKRGRSR